MTENELMRIDLAMESVNGNRAQAAAILDIPKRELKDIIRNNTSLHAKWWNGETGRRASVPTEAPTALETMTLDVPLPAVPPVSPDEQAVAAIVHNDDVALRQDLAECLGLNPEEADEAVSLAEYHKKHGARSVDLFGASIVKRGLRLSVIIAKLERDIVEGQNMRDIWTEDGAKLIRSGEESKFDLLYRGLAELRKMTELAHTGALARAKMRLWDKHGSMNGRKERRPGFAPLKRPVLVNVQAGGTAVLNDNNGKEPQDGSSPPPD